MTGGLAFVLDEAGDFQQRCNLEMVDLEPLVDPEDVELVRDLLAQHVRLHREPGRGATPGGLGAQRRPGSSR